MEQRGNFRKKVLNAKVRVGYFSGLLESAFEKMSMFDKADKVAQQAEEIQELLDEIYQYLSIDRRGLHNAKPEAIKSQVMALVAQLPEDEVTELIEEIEKARMGLDKKVQV